MSQQTMYPPQANSPGTELAQAITADAVELTVQDGDVLLEAPNTVTIGSDETAETILYGKKEGNVLSEITRAWDGTASKAWTTGSKVARYLNAQDISAIQHNIRDLNGLVDDLPEKVQEIKDEVTNLDWQKHPLTQDDGSAIYLKDQDVNELVRTGRYLLETPVNAPAKPSGGNDFWYVDVTASTEPSLVYQSFTNSKADSLIIRRKIEDDWVEYSRDLVNTSNETSTKSYTFYVDGTNGSDDNDGIALATAFKTINKALALLKTFKTLNHTYAIYIKAGTYDESISLSGIQGSGSVSIRYAESADVGQDKIKIISSTSSNCNVAVTINGLTATTTGNAFYALRSREVTFNNCYTITGAGIGFYFHTSSGAINGCVATNTKSYAIYAVYAANVSAISISGTGNNIGIYASYTAFVAKNVVSMTAITAEQMTGGAMIR